MTADLMEPVPSHDTATLPDDLLREQLLRVQLLYAAGAILWSITFVLDINLSPNGNRGPYRLVVEGAAILLAVATIAFVRLSRAAESVKIAAGSMMVIAHAFAIALLNSWEPQPVMSRPISGIALLILLYGMIAPATPGRTLVISMIAASMDPLGVWIAHWRGLPVPPPFNTVAMFYLNYACASLAVVPARIVYRLGRKIRQARALGSYQLLEPLGCGGMGEVWMGRHRLLARTAAIKLIRPDILDGGDRDRAINNLRRFELEAKATAALTSPHTIRVFDFGLARDGTFYYVMELLDGRDLESLVREFGPLPPARVLYLVRQICASLAEAHDLGLVHRDVKPANIFTCRMGQEYDFVKVLDFGIVKHEHRPTAPTAMSTGFVTIGTPAYMAPEVILGEDADRRVDVYALGCVTYFLLTGEQVFDAPSPMKLLMQHVTTPPLPPSARSPYEVPASLDRFVMACLSKNPDARPATIDDALRLLNEPGPGAAWSPPAARLWWETHLPQLASKARTLSRNHVCASGYTAGAASAPAPLQPSIY